MGWRGPLPTTSGPGRKRERADFRAAESPQELDQAHGATEPMQVQWTCRCGKQQPTLNGHEGSLDNAEIQEDLRLGDGLADGSDFLLSDLVSPFAEERRLSRYAVQSRMTPST